MDDAPPNGREVGLALGVDDRDQPAGRVFAILLEKLLLELRTHEDQVRRDEGAEPLHAYRVVLRRTRAVLDAGSSVFPEEERTLLLAMIARLFSTTSPVRDLDVLLVAVPGLCNSAPETLRGAEHDLMAQLDSQRRSARAALDELTSGDYVPVMMRRWQRLANMHRIGGGEPGPDAQRRAGEVISEVVLGSFGRVRRRGRRATRSEDPTEWHVVRKRAKKLRYQLRAVRPLYADRSLSKVDRRLTRLQTDLGEMSDHVAATQLLMEAGTQAGSQVALLAGALVGQLSLDTPTVLEECRSAWERFDRPGTRRRLEEALADA